MIRTEVWRDQRERRFHLAATGVPSLLRSLADELPALTYAPGTGRTLVVTTYLDSVDHDYLRLVERTSGRRSVKMRVREYIALYTEEVGAPRLVASPTCYLERKERVGQIRVKQRIELAKSLVGGVLRGEVALGGHDVVAGELRAEIERRALSPVLVSGYRRRVFGADGGLRVTIDEQIEFYRPPGALYEGVEALTPAVLGQPAGYGPHHVVEVKEPAGSATPAWLERIMATLEPADQRSKFREGMRCMNAADEAPRARAMAE